MAHDRRTGSVRAVSRVRFGVNMTRETDSGITFGATIRADNSQAGQGGRDGQRAGSVFVSGAWGTLCFGDTNGADEQWVGDVPGNFSLTGLTDINETRFVSNGGSFGHGGGEHFAANPFARPTVRYDHDAGGFGLSVSTNRDLTDVAVGAGYAGDVSGGSWSLGAGYYRFDSFTEAGDATLEVVDTDGDGVPDAVVEGQPVEATIPDGEQRSVGVKGEYAAFSFGVTYTRLDSDSADVGQADADNLLVGVAWSASATSVGAYWGKILSANGPEELEVLDGADAYGLTAQSRRRGGGGRGRGQDLSAAGLGQSARPGQRDDRRLRHPHGVLRREQRFTEARAYTAHSQPATDHRGGPIAAFSFALALRAPRRHLPPATLPQSTSVSVSGFSHTILL